MGPTAYENKVVIAPPSRRDCRNKEAFRRRQELKATKRKFVYCGSESEEERRRIS
jgi:hypothetical protein